MNAIRRSFKGEKDRRPPHNSIPPKSAIAIQPPKKVIKAKFDYEPDIGNTQELGFTKGDFFHVISRENDEDWYEACNPLIPSARGLVPVSYFEVVGKDIRGSAGSAQSGASNIIHQQLSYDSGYGDGGPAGAALAGQGGSLGRKSGQAMHSRGFSASKSSGAMVYGFVMYDFKAERPDELDAEAGESIIIIAQSNPEWFVAKPIKRLGGPGLIPVSFIEIRDMTTGQAVPDAVEAVQRAGVPKVEEWKQLTASYKNSSIELGKFSSDGGMGYAQRDMERMSLGNNNQAGANGNYHQRQPSKGPHSGYEQQRQLLAPVTATIPRYIFENDKYWYIIECQMEDGRWWELSRTYQKFYDFQIALLQQFPKDAQAPPGGKRLLPFMPGPVTYVTDAISNGRRESLNTYVKELLALPAYISRCELVRELFAPRDGDYELDPERVSENFRHSGASQGSMGGDMSRQSSSQGRINGNGNGYPTAANGSGPYGGMPASLKPQSSSLTQTSSATTNGSTRSFQQQAQHQHQHHQHHQSQSQGAGAGAIKIKVVFEDETIVIRVPTDISFVQLRDKCKERLKIASHEDIMVSYRDEPSGGRQVYEMLSDRDLDVALERCQRLILEVSLL